MIFEERAKFLLSISKHKVSITQEKMKLWLKNRLVKKKNQKENALTNLQMVNALHSSE